jgi:hypothetical protein
LNKLFASFNGCYIFTASVVVVVCCLQRLEKRTGWESRYNDVAFKSVPSDCRPMPIPFVNLPSPYDKDDSTVEGSWFSIEEANSQLKKVKSLRNAFIELKGIR